MKSTVFTAATFIQEQGGGLVSTPRSEISKLGREGCCHLANTAAILLTVNNPQKNPDRHHRILTTSFMGRDQLLHKTASKSVHTCRSNVVDINRQAQKTSPASSL